MYQNAPVRNIIQERLAINVIQQNARIIVQMELFARITLKLACQNALVLNISLVQFVILAIQVHVLGTVNEVLV